MANVKKIKIKDTSYDIADAKALRNKDNVGTGSFIDTRAGTSSFPTAGNNLTDSIVIGNSAYINSTSSLSGEVIFGNNAYANLSYSTVIGNSTHANGTQTTSVGYAATANANYATAIGASSYAGGVYATTVGYSARVNSGNYAIALGPIAQVTGSQTVAIGYNAVVNSQYSTVLGSGAHVGSGATQALALGYNAVVSNYNSYSNAIGSNARTTSNYATQIGEGTNSNYGSLQFRDWQLLDSSGKIPNERLRLQTMDSASPINLYSLYDEDRTNKGLFYTGQTCDALKQNVIYKSDVRYSYPRVECGWVNNDALPNPNHVIIDQQKFFLKCAEISKQRIDNDDTRNSFVGGDNSSQDMYFYYDKASSEWHIEFGADSFEGNQIPDNVENITLADFGIYCPGLNLDWMDADATEEIFDINYYAPCYCDSYDYNDSGAFYIDYMTLMESMYDEDWGFGKVIDDIESWDYAVGGTTYEMPIIPQKYISLISEDEWESVEVRWEWDDNEGKWVQYINGNAIGRSWTTADMQTTFGITITQGEESNLEYIGITFRGAEQRYWAEVINKEDFATTGSVSSLQAQITFIDENKVIHLLQNPSGCDLNNLTQSGIYHLTAGMSNGPSSVYPQQSTLDAYVIVTNKSSYISQTLIVNQNHFVVGSADYGRYMPTIFVRSKVYNGWGTWEIYLTPEASGFINGFDYTKKQTLVHDANAQTMRWGEGGVGGAVDSVNGKTGVVVLTATDVGALPDSTVVPDAQIQSDWNQADNTKVDFIKNKPTIPEAQVNSDWNANSGVAQILNKPTLATVATSGSYNDLSNKPTIPTVNNPTITITQGGVIKGSFTLNQATGDTIALDAGGTSNIDFIVEKQEPTAENNYTWYRKYASGWVEQGGVSGGLNTVVTLPVEMADTNYTLVCSGVYAVRTNTAPAYWSAVSGDRTSTTTITLGNPAGFPTMGWQVSGMAAN